MIEEACKICGRNVPVIAVANNILLTLMKGYVGFLSGSSALLADAIHSSGDIICAISAALGTRISDKPINRKRPYGYGKVEFVVGIFIGLVLTIAAANILYSSIKVLFFTQGVLKSPAPLALLAALISIGANIVISRFSTCAARKLGSPALKAISIDNLSDAVTSIPVAIAVFGAQLGLPQLDALGAILVGLIVCKMALGLVKVNYEGLMDTAIESEKIHKIRDLILGVEGVIKIVYLRTRSYGRKIWVDTQIAVEGKKSMVEAGKITSNVRASLIRNIKGVGEVQVMLKPIEES
jgi:cation diffusion facilitator family transporter